MVAKYQIIAYETVLGSTLNQKVLPSLDLFVNTTCNLQQLFMFCINFVNSTLVFKDIEPKHGSNKARTLYKK